MDDGIKERKRLLWLVKKYTKRIKVIFSFDTKMGFCSNTIT